MARPRDTIANVCVLAGLFLVAVAGWLASPALGLLLGGLGLLVVAGLLARRER